MLGSARRYQIGYALEPKKVQSFIQTSLLSHAKQRSIDLMRIDPNKPLIEQGPFDCVIHKLNSEDWKQRLREFSLKNPNVPIIDSPESVERLHSRISMLQVVNQLKIPQGNEDLGVPKQVVVFDSETLMGENVIRELNFPVIAKSLVADGSETSHKMHLVFDSDGIQKLTAPIVLQEFVNHGGVVFKVYVVGEHVKCVKRRSLPDLSEERLMTLKGSLLFSQISNLTAQDGSDKSENCGDIINVARAEMPPLSFIEEIARAMRETMGLNLFNFDVIRDAKDGNRYLVIDINYFPGYAKMPSYESVLTDFFWDVVHKKNSKMVNLGIEENDEELSGDNVERKLVSNTTREDRMNV